MRESESTIENLPELAVQLPSLLHGTRSKSKGPGKGNERACQCNEAGPTRTGQDEWGAVHTCASIDIDPSIKGTRSTHEPWDGRIRMAAMHLTTCHPQGLRAPRDMTLGLYTSNNPSNPTFHRKPFLARYRNLSRWAPYHQPPWAVSRRIFFFSVDLGISLIPRLASKRSA